MHRNRMLPANLLAVALLFAVVMPASVPADIDNFTLTRAIPADAFMAVHMRGHEGQAFLNKQYERVWKAIEAAHFDRDIHGLLKTMTEQQGGDLEEFEAKWQQMMDLLAGVEWSSLWQREFAYAEKLGLPGFYEGVLLMQPPADKVAQDFEGLSAFLRALAGFAPEDLMFTEDRQGATVIHKLMFANAPFPIGLTLARHEDVLLVGFGSAMVEQSLAMLRGEQGTTLASTPRFQAAFKSLPPPQDSLTFVDVAKLMDQLRSMLSGIKGMIPPPPEPPGEIPMGDGSEPGGPSAQEQMGEPMPPPAQDMGLQVIGLIGKVIDMLDMWEYVADVATTDGMKTNSQSITVLREDAESHPLYAAFYGAEPLKDPLKYVPKAASDVQVCTGVDFLILYRELLKFIANEVPDGDSHLAVWAAMQEGWELNVEEDILGWLQGGMCSFSVPGRTAYSPADWVLMLRVRDEEKAGAIIDRLLAAIEPHLAPQGGAISPANIEGAEGFRSVIYPMLAMLGLSAPTVGVKDGWLLVGSSPKVIGSALAVAAGEAESFTQNEQFIRDGIAPAPNCVSLSFGDLRNLGKQTGQMLQMVPAIIRLADASSGGQLAKKPGVDTLLRLIAKIGRVAPEFNFLQSKCSQSTFDGKTVMTRTVVTYCEPPQPPASKPAPEEEEPQAPPSDEPEG